ncbi:Uncharacterized protein GBIM_01832 [Gryllus bimaculatus]|nr:Uncharacterized protein GBIM_01832 [Gryllus bimaculatus]
MRSRAFWAILVAHLGGNCGLYCLITQVPTFIKTVLQQGLQMNTTYSSIPYITMFLVSVTAGPAIDHLRNNNHISTTAARKTGASIGLLMAMTNTLASIAGIAVPQMMSMLTAEDDGPFAWDDVVQGYVRGAYYYGYLLAQLPGALLAERRGAKWVLWAANALNVAGLLLTPLAARAGYGVFAVTFPAMHVMMSNWAPPEERGVIGGIVYAGTSLGTIGATLVGGYVSAAAGWPWVFYALGLASLPWCALWAWLVDDHPATATHICQQERLRLCDQLGQPRDAAALELPVRAVCSSGAFWALLATHFCSNCGWYMFLTELPGFMQEVLHKNIKENAGISAVPYVLMWLLRRLMAITNTIATIPGILMPILIGVLTEGQETLARWSIAFYITAALYALMFIVFTFCGSGEEQPWNNPDEVMGGLLDPEYNPANFIDSLDPYFTHERTQVTA